MMPSRAILPSLEPESCLAKEQLAKLPKPLAKGAEYYGFQGDLYPGKLLMIWDGGTIHGCIKRVSYRA